MDEGWLDIGSVPACADHPNQPTCYANARNASPTRRDYVLACPEAAPLVKVISTHKTEDFDTHARLDVVLDIGHTIANTTRMKTHTPLMRSIIQSFTAQHMHGPLDSDGIGHTLSDLDAAKGWPWKEYYQNKLDNLDTEFQRCEEAFHNLIDEGNHDGALSLWLSTLSKAAEPDADDVNQHHATEAVRGIPRMERRTTKIFPKMDGGSFGMEMSVLESRPQKKWPTEPWRFSTGCKKWALGAYMRSTATSTPSHIRP